MFCLWNTYAFSLSFDSPLIPSAVKIQRENLKEFERQHFDDYSVFELIDNRTQFCDDLLKQLWQQFELDKAHLTLIAVGGYGRREMFPLSDLDVLILSKEERESETEEKIWSTRSVSMGLWIDIGHSVRS